MSHNQRQGTLDGKILALKIRAGLLYNYYLNPIIMTKKREKFEEQFGDLNDTELLREILYTQYELSEVTKGNKSNTSTIATIMIIGAILFVIGAVISAL